MNGFEVIEQEFVDFHPVLGIVVDSDYNKNKQLIIVMIDSITNSACLCYYVQNGLSYLGKET